MGRHQVWTEKRDNYLIIFWGMISAREIGERLGVTKNAVIGRAHRLKLPKVVDIKRALKDAA
jgi:GcrA cell cycle regulator